jgi:hypothetical protein
MWKTFNTGRWLQSTYIFRGWVILNQDIMMKRLMPLATPERNPASFRAALSAAVPVTGFTFLGHLDG